MPRVIGGRFGLSSKEFTPGMVMAVFDELKNNTPKNGFTIGIHDDDPVLKLEVDGGAATVWFSDLVGTSTRRVGATDDDRHRRIDCTVELRTPRTEIGLPRHSRPLGIQMCQSTPSGGCRIVLES